MLEEVDIAVVATPNREHVPVARAALDAGVHVVVDKPLAVTASEGRELVEEAHRAGRVLTVFQNRRWDGDFLTVRRLLERGELGQVVRFESRFERWRPKISSEALARERRPAGGRRPAPGPGQSPGRPGPRAVRSPAFRVRRGRAPPRGSDGRRRRVRRARARRGRQLAPVGERGGRRARLALSRPRAGGRLRQGRPRSPGGGAARRGSPRRPGLGPRARAELGTTRGGRLGAADRDGAAAPTRSSTPALSRRFAARARRRWTPWTPSACSRCSRRPPAARRRTRS